MPAKKQTPAPIDRPLSRAYLRSFVGWSTAYPPGLSEPNSLRLMENMWVDRNGGLVVRPGLRYLTYAEIPDEAYEGAPGTAYDRPFLGTQEPFYTLNGDKALLCTVREDDGTVGFRAILFTAQGTKVHMLTDPEIDFNIPQATSPTDESVLAFTEDTTYVSYLQIDNKILALSNAGEYPRMFFVGGEKVAKRLNPIHVPWWDNSNKLRVVHPDAAWINKQAITQRLNVLQNPSFEGGSAFWSHSKLGKITSMTLADAQSGTRALKIESIPTRTNLQTSPLHDVATTGIDGWGSHQTWGKPKLTKDTSYLKVTSSKGKDLFLAYGARLTFGVVAGAKYRLAMDVVEGPHVQSKAVLTFYNASGSKIVSKSMSMKDGRYVSGALTAPAGTVSMRVSVGGESSTTSSTYVKVKNVVLCRDGEPTGIFHGGSGANYYWVGTANASASVYHPPTDVAITSNRGASLATKPLAGSIYIRPSTSLDYTFTTVARNKSGVQTDSNPASGTVAAGSWTRVGAVITATAATATRSEMTLIVKAIPRGHWALVDAALLEPGASGLGTYFDGSTKDTAAIDNSWGDPKRPHAVYSRQIIKTDPNAVPVAETPTVDTLMATGGAAANEYKVGVFYTFSNEIGESAPSKITEVRTKRPWSNWIWETANASGEPSGTATDQAELCADQLVVSIPEDVFDQALADGAVRWNLYAFTWSDQEAVPVTAQLIEEKQLYTDGTNTTPSTALTYDEAGWIAVTPARKIGLFESGLPTVDNRENYSAPPRGAAGAVAGDRAIIVGDPYRAATVVWSANQPGHYTNFSPPVGGGVKTLTSGNLNIPAAVALWQNPQSVDTLTILCLGTDGRSVCHYMAPASVGSGNSGIVSVMGFEETTNTPGTVAPYAVEVMNNALYRPLDTTLLKSTAQNYNINHKTLTDKISNMWQGLMSKQLMCSAQLDNRLYLLVHNPFGALLGDGCRGNEIWVYDISAEMGNWSRFLIQAAALRVVDVGNHTYLGVTTPDGVYYLDPTARLDDYPDDMGTIQQRPIPWQFETNTQGANRAHDAWAHLQQVAITLGNFSGTMEYGIRGLDMHGMEVDISKRVTDDRPLPDTGYAWDIEDPLMVRRDLKEWVLYGRSVEGKAGSGQISYAQYRYTPVSVNVGYEFGSVETFEYAGNVEGGPTLYAENGVPRPYIDYGQ